LVRVADDLGPAIDAGSPVDEVVAAASEVLGRVLTGPVVVSGGSGRSMVLRCEDPAGGTVIVKRYPETGEGPGSFAAEAAGLELATGSGLSPDLLGASKDRLVVVMADLGPGLSMADVLLGRAATDARAAVLSWAGVCGDLSAMTSGRLAELPGLVTRYSAGPPGTPFPDTLAASVLRAPDRAALLGVIAPAGLAADLATVASSVQSGQFGVFTPGDLCPDNNLLTPAGVRLIDFEAAAVYPVFLDAAYIRMPFSTCWCVFRMPAELSQAAEARYRTAVCAAWPGLADDAVWQPGIRRGIAAWTMNSMSWLLGRALKGDPPLDAERTSPRARQLIRHRWQVLAGELEAANDLPSLAEFARSLLSATAGWHAGELPLYPAFR
jgi:Phosphotransferase enzyme family